MEEKAVEEIVEILTQEGMTVKQANSVFSRVQLILMESSKNFLDGSDAKEVFGTPNRYNDKEKKILSYENGRPVFKNEMENTVVDLTDEPLDLELSEEEIEEFKKKVLWSIGKDEETGVIEIRPMNKENCITLHGADWVKWFIEILKDTIKQ